MTSASMESRPRRVSIAAYVPVAGRILGLKSRSAAYRAAARGDLPTISMCGKLFVPTELVLQKIGLRPAVDAEPRAAS